MRQVFVDLDGVLADFDGHYETCFGIRPDRAAPDPPDFWTNIDGHGQFFRELPPMPDALALWNGVCRLHPGPVILTGLPLNPSAEQQKREWVREHIGDAPVICCRSKDKRRYGTPGDILIDDWFKYQSLWEEMGGIFILHTSAVDTLHQLAAILEVAAFDFLVHLRRQRAFSERTFGPGARTAGVLDHIRKELREIEAEPAKLSEWIDVVILALDGAWRAGHAPEAIIAALMAKQAKNEARTWPDWRTAPLDKAIEHVRVPAASGVEKT